MARDDDDHVTIRGQRVVLGEIESILQEHAKVRQVAVCVQQVDNEERLIAYIVAEGTSPTVNQLRTYLENRVPAHLVPSVFVSLDALPLTAEGTIDRAALPAPNPVWLAVEQNYVAPRNPVEAAIAEIWAEVLLVDRVGIHDDFLELGGDSLIGTQMVARLFEQFGTEIPLESLFERGTIAELVEDFFSETRPREEGV
jgi:acyl carrier protein